MKTENLISYKCRAEIPSEAYRFAMINSNDIWAFKVERIEKDIPDVVVSFQSKLTIEELKLRMSKIEDTHVMYESLKLENEYDGKRIS